MIGKGTVSLIPCKIVRSLISFIHVPGKNAKSLKLLLEAGVGRTVWGNMYDRHRCSEKCESLIPHFDYSKFVSDGLFLISFIHVPAKKCKTVKTLT